MAQLIQGTDITLYGVTNTTVSNVLIGEPSADGKTFTLGIPKGDTNDWADRKIGFFGRIFRSIGFPAQGIEANIPLSWHKKVQVEYAPITGKCTVYEKNTFTKHVFADVYYHDGRGERTKTTGAEKAEDVTVNIYSFAHDGSYIPKIGDIIVSGECEYVFDASTEAKASASMATFRSTYPGYALIKSVDSKLNGNKFDIDIIGR